MLPHRDGELETPLAPLGMRPYPHYVCPRCRKIIEPDADKCVHCNQTLAAAWSLLDLIEEIERLGGAPPQPPSEPTEAPQLPRIVAVRGPVLSGDWDCACPVCGAEVVFGETPCGGCGQKLAWAEDDEAGEESA